MQFIAGPGQGLQPNVSLYPTQLGGTAPDTAGNEIALPAGGTWTVPPGRWMIDCGKYSAVQYNDPVTGTWRFQTLGAFGGLKTVYSDGQNFRVANLTGCPVAAQVSVAGSAYTQAGASVTATGGSGTSTWQAIVGGQLSVLSVPSAGTGYGIAPLVLIGPPPMGLGVQATGYAFISANTVSSVGLLNVGAGYTSVPPVTIVPNPYDPNNLSTPGKNAVVSVGLFGAGSVSAVLCTNNGIPLTSVALGTVTITIGGPGASASVVAVNLQTITSIGIPGVGVSLGVGAGIIQTAGGGVPITSQWTNPAVELNSFVPRQYIGTGTLTGGSLTAVAAINDGGLFLSTPTPGMTLPMNGVGGLLTGASLASLSLFMGSASDTILVQQF